MIATLIYLTIGLGLVILLFWTPFVMIVEEFGLTGGEMEAFAVVYLIFLVILFRIAPIVTEAFGSLKP